MRDIKMIVQGDCRLLSAASADKIAMARILLHFDSNDIFTAFALL
jgi:hypothetical protein